MRQVGRLSMCFLRGEFKLDLVNFRFTSNKEDRNENVLIKIFQLCLNYSK